MRMIADEYADEEVQIVEEDFQEPKGERTKEEVKREKAKKKKIAEDLMASHMVFACSKRIRIIESNIVGSAQGGELIFRAALHRRLPGGQELPIITTELLRPPDEEDRVREFSRQRKGLHWWLTVSALTMACLITAVDARMVMARFDPTFGGMHYAHSGDVYLGAGTATIAIDFACSPLFDALETFHRLANKAGGPAKWIALASEHDLEALTSAVSFYEVQNEESKHERILQERDIGALAGVYNFFSGLFNKAKINDLEVRLDGQERAAKLEMHELDGVEKFVQQVWRKTNQSEQLLGNAIEDLSAKLQQEAAQRILFEEFASVNANATAVTRVLRAASSHMMDPALADLVDFKSTWEDLGKKLRAKGMELPSSSWQHLFSMNLDVFARNRIVTIAIHLPTKPAEAVRMTGRVWIPSPIFYKDKLMKVSGNDRKFATDQDGGVVVIGEIAACWRFGNTDFCRGPVILERKDFFTTCVSAVWRMDMIAMRQLCHTELIPVRDMILPIAMGSLQLVVGKNETPILIECKNRQTMSKVLNRGMYDVKLAPTCWITTTWWKTQEGRSLGVQTTSVKLVAEDLEVAFNHSEIDMGETGHVLDTIRNISEPTPISSVKNRVMNLLAVRGDYVHRFWITIGIVIFVAVGACAAIAYFVFRNKQLHALIGGEKDRIDKASSFMDSWGGEFNLTEGGIKAAIGGLIAEQLGLQQRDAPRMPPGLELPQHDALRGEAAQLQAAAEAQHQHMPQQAQLHVVQVYEDPNDQ